MQPAPTGRDLAALPDDAQIRYRSRGVEPPMLQIELTPAAGPPGAKVSYPEHSSRPPIGDASCGQAVGAEDA